MHACTPSEMPSPSCYRRVPLKGSVSHSPGLKTGATAAKQVVVADQVFAGFSGTAREDAEIQNAMF